MPMPAGGCTYKDGIVWAAQGVLTPQTAGLVYLKAGKAPEVLLRDYYGHDFNSPYDVSAAQDGSLWFTDPVSGTNHGWRPKPGLPPRIYRFVPGNGEVRAMTDDLRRPMGLAISPDQSTLYVADSPEPRTSQEDPIPEPSAIYAFDIVIRADSPFLTMRRVFAAPLHGAPICVRCDKRGNVWVASGHHVEIWSPGANLLGVVRFPSPYQRR
ncbi:Gluconolactonase [Paramyrothecium foliicola]|nr:Gluconolactonase [Paramyrothecium foliicola]